MIAGGAREARPRTPEEVSCLQECPDVVVAAEGKGIKEIVHFTTLTGSVGILATSAVKSRSRLGKESYLQYVYRPNVELRKDEGWLDYVNLSIERINDWMYDSSARWHADQDNPWVLLSFTPRILAHPGVVFTTTNNIYPACRRAEGLAGFNQLFAAQVHGRYGKLHDRRGKLPQWPTDRQAEVLYPMELSCEHLQCIYAQNEDGVEGLEGALGGLGVTANVQIAPEVFK